MRFVVHGVGAVGGVVAAALAMAGEEVAGIARGLRLEAIRKDGLRLRTHLGDNRVRFDCHATPAELGLRPDDVILLAVKSQDTREALDSLRAAGMDRQPLFCLQNGVANERMALRLFPNVHAVNVLLPAEYMQADEAIAFGTPNYGVFDIGRYPNGADAADTVLAEALTRAGIAGFVQPDAMRNKYGKLILNLGNIVEAVLGHGVNAPDVTEALRAEAAEILDHAGIAWSDMGEGDPRRGDLFSVKPIAGIDRLGNSSTQSLARGAGAIETDYLNGEIALIARLNGREAPLNARVTALAAGFARERRSPGAITPGDLRGALGL